MNYIAVSGYQPVLALTMHVRGQWVSVSSAHAVELDVPEVEPLLSVNLWCAGCRHLVARPLMQDARLGFRGYCLDCVRRLGQRCLEINQRLPFPGEFYCSCCGKILALAEMCNPERDGRQRRKCRMCRLEQLRAARKARQLNGKLN